MTITYYMHRPLFTFALILLIAASSVIPAYSLSFNESGPLTSIPNWMKPYQQGLDTTATINGIAFDKSMIQSDFGFINLGDLEHNRDLGRTLVYGSGDIQALGRNVHVVGLGGSLQNSHSFLGVAVSSSPLPSNLGFSYAADSPLQFDFDEEQTNSPGRLSGSSIIGSEEVSEKYGINGTGATIAIVDTGTDFSNPDMMHALARDHDGVPIMLDADGQGIVLTRATYIAKIDDRSGKILDAGYTPKSELPGNVTSYVYVNNTGMVFLRTSHGEIPVYNTLYPFFGTPILNATARVDWIIGHSPNNYIRSSSGIYRFGVIYQLQQQFGTITFGLVPVLVVDSEKPGVYDTVIPDMYSAWYFYVTNELARLVSRSEEIEHLIPEPSFDFTDDVPIRLGDGNEFLNYDYNDDGFPDFTAGTVGARVVDLWQVANNKTESAIGDGSSYGGVMNAELLEPLDPEGDYFGIMYDYQGHGSNTAATIASAGAQKYDIYANGTNYSLSGIAPGAKIIPVKALWAGDSLYGWLYSSGFDLGKDGIWRYSGDHKADIISNSWGVASFPLLQYGPGYDMLSVISSLLVVPGLLADNYPGTLFVNSIGNNGLGYGTVGIPNSSPLAISVGATTNNVHVGYNGFQNVTRFGNAITYYDDVADFSSRGPGLFGDPKPELMAVGSYGFTPTIVNLKNLAAKPDDPNNDGAFVLFGGTSMAAPMVAGAAALVIEALQSQGREINPLEIRTIMMSSAVDLKNDPFVQGSGRVDALAAVDLAEGASGKFMAYTTDTVPTILDVMSRPIQAYNETLGVIESGKGVADKLSTKLNDGRWFAGYIDQNESASTEIVLENPSSKGIQVEVSAVIEKLVAKYEMHNSTRVFETDPIHNSAEFGYVPNYYDLREIGSIPSDADLMVARATFPFESFMNGTELYADYLRIASLYAYDWIDSDEDGKVSYTETSMINRGGSWGTVQELRISDPIEKFKNEPLIGVYPVPTVYSFWQGDRQINSTAMNYTLTVEFYKRQTNDAIDLEGATNGKVSVMLAPKSNETVKAIIKTTDETIPGVYYGMITIDPVVKSSRNHSVLMPVSYVVTTKPVQKDVPVIIVPNKNTNEQDLGLRPNGYVGGLFDMTSRYAAGDWRSYYFRVEDSTITTMTLRISWPHNSTSINAMAFDPDGRIVSSSVPAGVFETFAGWPSNDWLGTTPFSEGGAFYFSQNAGENSTILHVPVNQTGVYSLLLHNTLFHGNSLYEPLQVEAKFTTLLPDSIAPIIVVDSPRYIGDREQNILVTITEDHLSTLQYMIDGNDPVVPTVRDDEFGLVIDGNKLTEGMHRLRIDSTDSVGHSTSIISEFEVDKTPPSVDVLVSDWRGVKRATDRIWISRDAILSWNVTDRNGVAEPLKITMPNGTTSSPEAFASASINSTSLQEGSYEFLINAHDTPGNSASHRVWLEVDRTPPEMSLHLEDGTNAQDLRGLAKIALGAEDLNIQSTILQVGERKSVNVTRMTEYELDTEELPDGQYELKLLSTDMAGNEAAVSTTITVANNAPQIMWAILISLAAGGGIASLAWFVFVKRKA
jgi:subtilase family protein